MEIKNLFSNRNILIVATLFFVAWVTFFDRNNYIDIRELDARIKEMEQERDYYKSKITEDSTVVAGLADSAYLEKYAREHFFMKRAGEKMYLIKNKE